MQPGIKKEDPKFGDYYGYSWVSSMKIGSEFCLVYNFESHDMNTTTSILAEMNVQGLGVGNSFNFSAGIENKVKSLMKKFTCNMNYKIWGISDPSLPDPNNYTQFISDFLKTKPDAPYIIDLDTQSYDNVPY